MSSANSSVHQKKLGWFLCWAIVFADIGTSIYYVPGILFGEVNNLAGLFVLMSSIVFILLVLKYIEITDRNPQGGGVVTVASQAFGPWFGALGGMFITVDYFLTASISAVSGFSYLNSIVNIGHYILIFSILGIAFLGILNVIGIQESAGLTAIVAVIAFIVDIITVLLVSTQIGPEGWKVVFSSLTQVSKITPWQMLAGFAGSFLAFSGLESISQLSPAMQLPRKRVATISMTLIVFAVIFTSPLLTLFSTNLITAKPPHSNETVLQVVSNVKNREVLLASTTDPLERAELQEKITQGKELSDRFISELGAQYGGTLIKLAIVATASVLLLFASNTAIIGAYHVFIALARQNFFPKFVETHNTKFGTPHWSVLAATLPPILIVLATRGDIGLLGSLYAFGLLGAFGLSSIGVDVLRWKGKERGIGFYIGVITSILVVVAWMTNLYSKMLATIFGGAVTVIGMILAYIIHSRAKAIPTAEVLTLADVSTLGKSQILVPVYDEFDKNLFEFVGNYAKNHKQEVMLLYVREFADILQTVADDIKTDEEASTYLKKALSILQKKDVKVNCLYEATNDAAKSINYYRRHLQPSITILSPHKVSLIIEFLKGDIVKKVFEHKNGNVLIYTGAQDTT